MARKTVPQNIPLEPLPVETKVAEALCALPERALLDEMWTAVRTYAASFDDFHLDAKKCQEQVLRDYATILRRRGLRVDPLPDGSFRLAGVA